MDRKVTEGIVEVYRGNEVLVNNEKVIRRVQTSRLMIVPPIPRITTTIPNATA